MPIKQLQQRLTQVGVIRLGEKRVAKSGKEYPTKLDSLRFTSPSRALIDAVSMLYGGDVVQWQSNTGPEWQVITTVREIPVLVPPQHIDPNNELWGKGYKSRMCDGETEKIRNVPCLCEQAARQRYQQSGWPWPENDQFERAKDDCKPTTRMSLMLADVPSLGTWKLESHGWNAAAELPMLADAIATAPQPIPARLEVQFREKKLLRPNLPADRQIESRNYVVPVLHFDFVTPAQAFGGQIGAAARTALARDPGRQAIGAGPDGREGLTPDEVVRLAGLVRNVKQLQQLWRDALADDALTDDVKKVLTARAAQVDRPAPEGGAEPAEPATARPEPQQAEVVEADTDEPDVNAAWMKVMSVAAEKGWNAEALEQRITVRFNKDSGSINGWQMQQFLTAVESGEIQ
jgi:hypothetical protein